MKRPDRPFTAFPQPPRTRPADCQNRRRCFNRSGKRDGQGEAGAFHPPIEQPPQRSICSCQLRGFPGAMASKAGKFEMAQGGTLLLDEIGEMPLNLQPKLLRVLQEREVDRLGDTRPIHLNIRVIATTNRSLRDLVREGAFRADLYYRLNVIPLTLPPLRERRDDIPELAEYFLRHYAPPSLRGSLRLAPELLARLKQHDWPGNVRELENAIRRALALSRGPVLGIEA